ncbi:MAG TPA: serine/threonine-protein kinase, partial [Myxococcota bacterium]|nr:serine/threonine-protein kinase [Myxococcota bacterium]
MQCCAGLAHAHELGIVHRDLSPENVMLTPTAEGPMAKIIDFGVARAALSAAETTRLADATLTRAGDFVGKPRYASPEQAGALRPGEELDGRSDLYSLGLVLYEMATGSLPFQSESAVGYLALQLYQAPPAPSELRPDLPPALERVILRCLEKDRARRFASANELGEALLEVARECRERPARTRSRPSLAALLAGAGAAALLLSAGAAWWWGSHVPTLDGVRSSPAAAAAPAPAPAEPAPAATRVPAPAAVAVAEPLPPPEAAPPAEVAPSVQPAPVAPAPAARPARPAPAPSPPGAAAFASEAEMQTAFEAALGYEKGHSAQQSVENWKRFRRRAPSHELDEKAKRRITELTLGGMREFP